MKVAAVLVVMLAMLLALAPSDPDFKEALERVKPFVKA